MKATSVNYSRLFNLGDYENEKVGISAVVEEGQDPEQVLAECKAWVKSQGKDYRDLDMKVDKLRSRKGDLEYNIYRLEEQTRKMLEKVEEINSILLVHGIQPDEDLQRIVKHAQERLNEDSEEAAEEKSEDDEEDD